MHAPPARGGGSRRHSEHPSRPERNRLLAALPAREHALLVPYIERLTLQVGQVLYEPGQPLRSVYFPEDCVVSLSCDPAGGRPIEVAMIGPEGFAGVDAIRGAPTTVTRCLVQIPGAGIRVPARVLVEAMTGHPQLLRALMRFGQALHDQTSLCAACNLLHSPRERFARWLLMMHDRVEVASLALTQEVMAYMLGTARQTVSAVARELHERGAIEHGRGRIRIADRAGLEALACGCYRAVTDRVRELLDHPAASH